MKATVATVESAKNLHILTNNITDRKVDNSSQNINKISNKKQTYAQKLYCLYAARESEALVLLTSLPVLGGPWN